jgi:L-alanine-DL-glutamate epimerase-like enolase superfamily enzyme
LGGPAFIPYLQKQAMDVAIVDAVWNGVWQSMKIANMADAYQVDIAPHNFYGHLATMMNAHFAASVPNLRIMETDIDRLPWDNEIFTRQPTIEDGYLILDDTPGWGTELNLEALAKYPPKFGAGFLSNIGEN